MSLGVGNILTRILGRVICRRQRCAVLSYIGWLGGNPRLEHGLWAKEKPAREVG